MSRPLPPPFLPRVDAQTALVVYAGVLTAALAWLLLTGTAGVPRDARFATITAERIDLREPDGTLRLAIASRARFPGIVWHGRERPHAGRTDSAGMIFFDDEGTENGGLIFGGRGGPRGATSFGHLSFDQHEQDQVVTLEQTEEEGDRRAGLTVSDRPTTPLDLELPARLVALPPVARAAEVARLRAAGRLGQPRLFLGKEADRAAVVALRDAAGRVRLRLSVAAGGDARIEFLDAAGRVVRAQGAAG